MFYTLKNGTIVDITKISAIVPNATDKSDAEVVAIIGIEGNRIGLVEKDLKEIKKLLKIK